MSKKYKINTKDFKHNFLKKTRPGVVWIGYVSFYKHTKKYGEKYICGLYDGLNYIEPLSRCCFVRLRDYQSYIWGYKNGKHLSKHTGYFWRSRI